MEWQKTINTPFNGQEVIVEYGNKKHHIAFYDFDRKQFIDPDSTFCLKLIDCKRWFAVPI